MIKRVISFLVALCILFSGGSEAKVFAQDQIDDSRTTIRVSEEDLNNSTVLQNFKNMGVNFEMSFTSDEMWQANGNWMEQSYANSGIKMIRWGYDAWVFDWQDEVPLNTNYQGGMNTKDALGSRGFREFINFATKYDIIPFIHIPFESWNHKNGTTIEEKKNDPTYKTILDLTANMAQYMQDKGIEVAYFDLGNEPAQAPSCPYGTFIPEEYGKAFPDFYDIIKGVNQNYKLVMQIESTGQYNQIKQYALRDGKYCFDAVDKHVYNSNGVGWEGYYNRSDDDIFGTNIVVDDGIEKIMGECNVPWPNFPTYSTNLGAAICLVNGFAKLAQDDDYSSIIMWPSQWSSNDTMYNAFNPTGKSFGWFNQDAWYDSKSTIRLNGPIFAEMIIQKYVLSHSVRSESDNSKIRSFAFTNEYSSELNIIVVNKEKSDIQLQLQVPQKYNKIKAVALTGTKDYQGNANTDENPSYHGHLSNCDVEDGVFTDNLSYGECVLIYTFYEDNNKVSPTSFNLIAPYNQEKNVSTAINFQWEKAEHATDYRIRIADNPEMINPVIDTTTGGKNNYQPSFDLENLKDYYWKVEAINKIGTIDNSNSVYVFSTIRDRHFVDDSDSSVSYTGNWVNQRYVGSYGRNDHGTGQAGAKMTITFSGTQAILYGIKDNWIRNISVKVDNNEPEVIDLYESRGVMQFSADDPARYSRGSGETLEQKKVRLDNIRPTQQIIYDTGKLSLEDEDHIIEIEVLEQYNEKEDNEVTSSWRGFEFDYYEIIKSNEEPIKISAELPELLVDLAETRNCAVGERVELGVEAISKDNGELSYEWYKDGRLLANTNSPKLVLNSIDENMCGIYQVRVTNTVDNSITRTLASSKCNIALE